MAPDAVQLANPNLQEAVAEAHNLQQLFEQDVSPDDNGNEPRNSPSAFPRDAVPQLGFDSIEGVNMDSQLVQQALLADVNILGSSGIRTRGPSTFTLSQKDLLNFKNSIFVPNCRF